MTYLDFLSLHSTGLTVTAIATTFWIIAALVVIWSAIIKD